MKRAKARLRGLHEAIDDESAAMPAVIHIPDVQNSADTRRLAINKVGIKDIRHPVRVRDRSGANSTPSPRSTCT